MQAELFFFNQDITLNSLNRNYSQARQKMMHYKAFPTKGDETHIGFGS